MSAEQLFGRGLDRAVAEAMGWGWLAQPSHYSTDYDAMPEMLEWLATFGPVQISLNDDANRTVDVWIRKSSFTPWRFGESDAVRARGRTLTEAIARLVVVVAEAKR